MIDTHAHLNFEDFKDDYQEVIKDNFKNGLMALINVGSNLETSQKAIKITKEFTGCYAALGLHPIHVEDEEFNEEKYKELIEKNKEKVKAIGETGLDFYHSQNNKEKQRSLFLKHISLANLSDLPIIIHSRGSKGNPRDAYLELLEIIKGLPTSRSSAVRGVIHCFSANREIVQEFLKLGFYVGFDGPITFKNADPLVLEAVKETPLNKILLETDSPYLTPEPYRGQRNQPVYIRFVAQKIAELKNISLEEVISQTTKNAQKLFDIKL
ncbi:MAG: TatD family hydrolase [Patescibacteria group bacterium]|nr:TatD family hydrolase [Patescibacteria group bacterium]MDD5172645.1 TatD family hydrolase [Patescibacteria group bacterium]